MEMKNLQKLSKVIVQVLAIIYLLLRMQVVVLNLKSLVGCFVLWHINPFWVIYRRIKI